MPRQSSRRSTSRVSGAAQSSAWSSEATGARSSKVEQPDEDDVDDSMPDGEYEIEAILSHDIGKMIPGQMSYLVSWVGYSENENSWITEEDAANAGEMLGQYWKAHGARPDIKSKPGPASRKGKSVAGGSAAGRASRRAALSVAANAAAADRSSASRKRNRANNAADALDESLDMRAERKRAREAASANFNRDANDDPSDLDDSDAEADMALNAKYRPEEIARRKNLRQVKKYEAMADWENIVKVVENVEMMPDSGKIVAFLLFENGSRQCYALEVANHRCPQKLLAFYQSRIRFKPTPSDAAQALRDGALNGGGAKGGAGPSGASPAQDEDAEMAS